MTEQSLEHWPSKVRITAWALAAVALCVPLAAMQFDSGVNWTGSDFLVAAVIVGGIGLMAEFLVRISRDGFYPAGAAAALSGVFLIVWSNLAVGIVGDGANGFNVTYMAMVALAILGAALVRCRARGMAAISALAVVTMIVLAVAAQGQEPFIWRITAFLSAPWGIAAALFWQAGREHTGG